VAGSPAFGRGMGGDIGLGGGIVRNSLYSFVVIFLKVEKIKIVKKKGLTY